MPNYNDFQDFQDFQDAEYHRLQDELAEYRFSEMEEE